jgi:biopolymer transport protein TolR
MVDLPSVGKAPRQPDKVVQVVVAKDEHLEVKNGTKTQALSLQDVAPMVLQAQSGQPAGSVAVVISADRSVKYETVVKVMDTLQRAGVQRVGLSVQLAPQ